jgi:PAS domain-containing protein
VFILRLSDGVLLDANEAFLSLCGLSRRDTVGRSTVELGLWVRPEDSSAYVAAVQQGRRVNKHPARFRSRWSEEFTLRLSSTVATLRGEEVILGVGTVVASS